MPFICSGRVCPEYIGRRGRHMGRANCPVSIGMILRRPEEGYTITYIDSITSTRLLINIVMKMFVQNKVEIRYQRHGKP